MSEPHTGTHRRRLTYREIIETLQKMAVEREADFKAFRSASALQQMEVLDAVLNLVLATLNKEIDSKRFANGRRGDR